MTYMSVPVTCVVGPSRVGQMEVGRVTSLRVSVMSAFVSWFISPWFGVTLLLVYRRVVVIPRIDDKRVADQLESIRTLRTWWSVL